MADRSGRNTLFVVLAFAVGIGTGVVLAPSFQTPAFQTPANPLAITVDVDASPEDALRAILSIEHSGQRATELAAFFERTDAQTYASPLLDLLMDRDAGLEVDEITELLFAEWWASADPEAAFNSPLHPRWKNRHPWMRQTVRAWAKEAPIPAARAVAQLPGGPALGRLEGARAVIDSWLSLDEIPDPRLLLEVIDQLEPVARSGALELMVSTLIKREGVDRALEIVRGIQPFDAENGDIRHELLSRTGVALAKHDIPSAVAWAEEYAETPNGLGIQKHLAYYWGLRDGAPALEWALSLPQRPGREIVIKRAFLSFSRKHREDASAWMMSHPPRADMRGIYADFLRRRAETAPEEAMALAERAADPELRLDMQAAAAEGWLKGDPEAAKAWLTNTDLRPDLEARIQQSGRRAGAAAARAGRPSGPTPAQRN